MIIAAAGEPGAVGIRDQAVLVVVDVLAEVPHGAIVGLGVEIERDLVNLPVEERGILRYQILDRCSADVHVDGLGVLQQGDLGPERKASHGSELQDPELPRHRKQLVGDPGGVGERRFFEVDSLARGRGRQGSAVGAEADLVAGGTTRARASSVGQ